MNDPRALAEAVRKACVEAALQAYEDAGLQGLCHDGRWECAIEAIRGLDMARVLAESPSPGRPSGPEPPQAG